MQWVPPGSLHHFDDAERRLYDADSRRVAHPAREAQGDGGHQVGPGDKERQRQPARRGDGHRRLDAMACQHDGGYIGRGVGRPDGRVGQRSQVFGGEAAIAQSRVGGIGHVHDPVPDDHLGLVV